MAGYLPLTLRYGTPRRCKYRHRLGACASGALSRHRHRLGVRTSSLLSKRRSSSWECARRRRAHSQHQHVPTASIRHRRFPPPAGYALPIPGVNHVRISGDDRHGCCCERLARWQCAAPAVLARAGWIAVPARHARVVQFGVRQPCCRASRAHDLARIAADSRDGTCP